MDPISNPFSSGLSIPPPVLVGRQEALEHARLLFARLRQGRGEKSLWFTGLRGAGKSVLLAALRRMAAEADVELEAVDEAHSLRAEELDGLIRRQEALLLEQAPKAVVLAGLPFEQQLEEASLALGQRVFRRFELGPLDPPAVAQALGQAADEGAVAEILRLSKGHPALVQAWAHGAWLAAPGPRITRMDVKAAAAAVEARLDADFYGPGFERLSPREKAYLRTMAHLGPGPHRSGDIADSMDAKITSLGPLRARLLRAGWIYSPAHGWLGFAAPGMDDFLRRVMPGFR